MRDWKMKAAICIGLFGCLCMVVAPVYAGKEWTAWKYRMPITLSNRSKETASLIPVDVTFSVFADQCQNPEKEIRLVLWTKNGEKEVSFQLSRLSRWSKDTDVRHRQMAYGNGHLPPACNSSGT